MFGLMAPAADRDGAENRRGEQHGPLALHGSVRERRTQKEWEVMI
jgi:hypothetical protein